MFQDVTLTELFTCVTNRWSPQIGDPNATGWLTVLAYLACALLAVVVLRARGDLAGRVRLLWVAIAVLSLFLAVNKQLDLQSALTAMGRCLAQKQGWYEERRVFQRQVIEGFVMATVVLVLLGLYLMRRYLRQNGIALCGLALVCAFVAVRAVGIHHVDALIMQRVGQVRANFLFELAGLALIALNALALIRAGRRRQDPAQTLRQTQDQGTL